MQLPGRSFALVYQSFPKSTARRQGSAIGSITLKQGGDDGLASELEARGRQSIGRGALGNEGGLIDGSYLGFVAVSFAAVAALRGIRRSAPPLRTAARVALVPYLGWLFAAGLFPLPLHSTVDAAPILNTPRRSKTEHS